MGQQLTAVPIGEHHEKLFLLNLLRVELLAASSDGFQDIYAVMSTSIGPTNRLGRVMVEREPFFDVLHAEHGQKPSTVTRPL